MTTEDFIKQCKSLFGDKYSYNNTNYINNRTYVCITCPTHSDNTDTIINDKNKLLKEIQKHGTFSC